MQAWGPEFESGTHIRLDVVAHHPIIPVLLWEIEIGISLAVGVHIKTLSQSKLKAKTVP